MTSQVDSSIRLSSQHVRCWTRDDVEIIALPTPAQYIGKCRTTILLWPSRNAHKDVGERSQVSIVMHV